MERLTLRNLEVSNVPISEAVEIIMAKSRDLDVEETELKRKGITIIVDDQLANDKSIVKFYKRDLKASEALRYLGELYAMKVVVKPYAVLLIPSSTR
jgi:hypothetical protein